MTGATDPSSTYTYAYDGSNRVTSVDNNGTPSMPRVILTYTYDYRDNVLTVSDNSSGTESYTWDGANNLTSAGFVVTGLSKKPKVELTYDGANRLSIIYRKDASASGGGSSGGNGLNTYFTFDNADRLTGMNHKYAGTSIRNYTWAFNYANELTQEVSYDGTVDYTYDNGSQVTGASGWRSETYSWDNTGNRTMTGYATGTGNRMTSDGVFNYTYDNEGNMTKKTRISNGEYTDYTWDHRNRLTRVEKRNSGGTLLDKSEYVYDIFDKRIATIVGVSSPVTTWTAYDGGNPYADFNSSGTLTSRYLAGRQLDQFFARFDASNSFIWYLTDHLGSVRDVANNTGTVLDHIKYDSFGGVVSESSPSNGDRFKFTGREYDATTGLYSFRARYYDAATGRFLAEDPISFTSGDVNLYRYVENAATMLVDPTGNNGQPQYAGTPPGFDYKAYEQQRKDQMERVIQWSMFFAAITREDQLLREHDQLMQRMQQEYAGRVRFASIMMFVLPVYAPVGVIGRVFPVNPGNLLKEIPRNHKGARFSLATTYEYGLNSTQSNQARYIILVITAFTITLT